MDGSGFDALTRAFSGLRSRRGLAQALLGAALGGQHILFDPDEAGAKRGKHHKRRKQRTQRRRDRQGRPGDGAQADKKKKKACPPCKKRKQGKCKGTLPDGAACPGGSCRAGSCVPTTPPPDCTPSCGGRVCGGDDGCGKSCGDCTGGQACQDGQCVLTCGSGLDNCAGTCVDLQTDTANCGTCGETCGFAHASATCQGGACTLGECNGDWRNCDDNDANGCETDSRTDLAHCGACGNACTAPANATVTCANSTCSFICNAGFHKCGITCVSNNDVAHCGDSCTACPGSICSPATCNGATCGNASACPSTEVCTAEGEQARCCPTQRPLWDGTRCAECTTSDVTGCAPPPHATATCDGQGTCGFTCDAGWGNCGSGSGCETHLKSDDANCGTCGHTCTGDERCYSGTCSPCLPATEDLPAAVAAASAGDTIRLCAGTWTLSSTLQIDKNLTLRGAGPEQTILAGGNAVRVIAVSAGASATLQDLQVTKGYTAGINFMDMVGGGILNDGTLALRGCRVTGNSATANGGGIYNTIDSLMLSLEGSSVTGNSAGNEAGGIYNFLGTTTLQDSSVTENTAFNGGGINSGGTLILTGSQVTNNTADHMGGGIRGSGTVTLAGSSVTGNSAGSETVGYGGGIHFERGTLTLKEGSSVANNAADSGGGILISEGDTKIILDGSSVTRNTATNVGGGVYNGYGTLTLKLGSSVTDNTATEKGGGIVNFGTVTLQDGSSVTNNTAGSGGGIYNWIGTTTMESGSRVEDNTAQDGGGMFNDPAYPTVVTLASTDIVMNNHLMDGTTVNNCAPANTIPNCIG